MGPSLAGFVAFIATGMGITTTQLPTNSSYIQLAYDTAYALVNRALAYVPSPQTSPSIYAQAIYNLAGDTLINIALDVPGQTFFADQRRAYGINTFVGGVIQSTSDEGTSESMVVPDFAQLLTLANLGQVKTPWGRAYISLAQSYGLIVGVS